MKLMNCRIRQIIMVILLMSPLTVSAVCHTPQPLSRIIPDVSVLDISPDIPLMSEIGGPFYSDIMTAYQCDFADAADVSFGIATSSAGKVHVNAQGHTIFGLNSEIGYTLGARLYGPGCPSEIVYIDGSDSAGSEINRLICKNAHLKGSAEYRGQMIITLYKIDTLYNDDLPERPIGIFTMQKNSRWLMVDEPRVMLPAIQTRLKSCDIDPHTPQIVDLGEVSSAGFRGKGSRAGKRVDFSVGLVCNAPTRASVIFRYPGANPKGMPDVVGLTPGRNSAKGVGIEITERTGGRRIAPDIPMPLIPSDGNRYAIRLNAGFIQSKKKITPGLAEAVLHYTIQYH